MRLIEKVRPVLGRWRRYGRYLRHRLGDAFLNIKTLDGRTVKPGAASGCFGYEPLSYAALKMLGRRVPMMAQDVLFDVGAGMGMIICYFARHPIRAASGIEVDRKLASRATANIARLRGKRAASASVLCGDARDHDYRAATVIVMYNPFDRTVMRPVLEKLAASLKEDRRRLRIVYVNPVEESLFGEFPQFKVADRFYAPYESGKVLVIVYEALPGVPA